MGKNLFIALTLAIGLATLIPRPVAAQTFTLSVMEGLDQYDRHRELAIDALARTAHLGDIEAALTAEGEVWINARGAEDAPRRRLVAAMFALEAARVGLDEEWAISARLIEWGCTALRKQKTPLAAERLWHRAALALIEGAYDFEFLGGPLSTAGRGPVGHLIHAAARFPDDPSIVMARAFLSTSKNILPVANNLWDGQASGLPSETVARLQDAAAVPSLAAEARIRLAFLHLEDNRFETAIEDLNFADARPLDTDLRYLSALFRAWTSVRQRKPDEAIASFRRALEAVPDAQTAALALGSALYLRGDRDEAAAVVESALAATSVALPERVRDPWLMYGYGDFRLWPQRIAALREAVR